MNQLIIFALLVSYSYAIERPHIIFIMADDLGWNDVGFHGSNQIPTPNIDALAYSGIILNNYYVTPICTPSRSALMTGKYPIHIGMQHQGLNYGEPRGLPLSEKLLPGYMRDLGYVSRMVGKWHLGFFKTEYTPIYRGFESHLGFWTGYHDYYDHTLVQDGKWGLDMRRNLDPAFDLHGKYTTDVITDESVKIIKSHNTSKPLFLYVAHLAVHSSNSYNPLPAPDEYVEKFSYIEDYKRRRFAAILTKLDESVGEIIEALSETGMLSNSIVVFTADNGGPAEGFDNNYASNYPLRGVKNTLWEGGIRGTAFIWSTHLKANQSVSNQKMHITDWLPTLYTAAGGNSRKIINGRDGIDMWKTLSENLESKRTEILHNIDDISKTASMTVGDWKIIKGSTYGDDWNHWYGPSGEDDDYNMSLVLDSKTAIALNNISITLTPDLIESIRNESKLNCNDDLTIVSCNASKFPCLFNIKDDPCEMRNLADIPKNKDLLDRLLNTLAKYNSTAIPPGNLPPDPRSDPKLWNYLWNNFGDYYFI